MSTHNIQFHDKIRKFPLVSVFLSYQKNFVGTQKRVRISHDERAIGDRAIEIRLYVQHRINNINAVKVCFLLEASIHIFICLSRHYACAKRQVKVFSDIRRRSAVNWHN